MKDDDELDALIRFHQGAEDHILDLLHRLGCSAPDVGSDEYVKQMYALTRYLGLSDHDFRTMDRDVFVTMLEQRVLDVEGQNRKPKIGAIADAIDRKPSGKAAGRPPATRVTVDGNEVKRLRHGIATQRDLAEASAMSIDTIQDVEAGRPVTKPAAEAVASGLSALLKRQIALSDLTPKKPKK